MNRLLGPVLMVTGIGHSLLGLVLFREPIASILGEGIANTIRHGQYARAAAFWFLLFGPICFLLGQLVKHAIEHGDRWLLTVVAWNLVAIGVVGALIMPVSGFWILIAIAPLVFRARGLEVGLEPADATPNARA